MKPRFCVPVSFAEWHITVDGERTLCGRYPVEEHHIRSTVEGEEKKIHDCDECWSFVTSPLITKLMEGEDI